MPDGPAGNEIRAAGALLWRPPALGRRWRPAGRGREVALIHRPKYDDWSFPKGKREPGEHMLQTAVREVAEETGLQVILGRPLTQACYDRGGRPKRVDYWVARPVPEGPDAFQANDEVDTLEWVAADAARGRLSYPHDALMLEEFTAGPASTVPFVLLRHASAGGKDSWKGDDLARPLDAHGAAEADLLSLLLACYGTSRVITSAAERCVATVRPYAALTGAKLEVDPALAVGQAEQRRRCGRGARRGGRHSRPAHGLLRAQGEHADPADRRVRGARRGAARRPRPAQRRFLGTALRRRRAGRDRAALRRASVTGRWPLVPQTGRGDRAAER